MLPKEALQQANQVFKNIKAELQTVCDEYSRVFQEQQKLLAQEQELKQKRDRQIAKRQQLEPWLARLRSLAEVPPGLPA